MKKIILLSFTLLTLAITSFGLLSQPVSGQAFTGSQDELCRGASLSNNTSACDKDKAEGRINRIVATIINILSFIVGVVAVIMIIINGLRLITSGGDSNSVAAARNGIIYAVIGLVLVAFAQIIVRFVLTKI